MRTGHQFNFRFRSPDTAWPQFSHNREQSEIDYEDGDIGSKQSLSDHLDCDSAEPYSHPDLEDEQPADTSPSNMASTASAGFLQLQAQMLRMFESTQSEAAELRQRVNELEEEKLKVVREGEDAYRTREAELLSRIDELVHETERLSDELVSKDDLQDELLQEIARLVAEMNMWAHIFSAVSKEMDEERRSFDRVLNEKVAFLKDQLLAVKQSIEDFATSLRAENAKCRRRLQDLKEHNTSLESNKIAPPRKGKEQDGFAKSQTASMEQTVARFRQRVAELERSRSTIETKPDQVADKALDEVYRLEAAIEEQNCTIEKQEHDLEEYRELQRRYLPWGGYQTSLPDIYMKSAKELEPDPAALSSISDDYFKEEVTSAASDDHLKIPAEVTNESKSQYLDEEQMPGNDAISQGKLDLVKETDAGLQEEVEALRRQNQYLQEKNDSLSVQEKKWRRTFEDFTHRAADVQRKDASKRQIKKGLKALHKIVKDVDLKDI